MKLLLCKEKGFSLLEALIAISIISILTVAAMAAFSLSIKTTSETSQNTVAVNLARERIEEIKQFEGLSLSKTAWEANVNGLNPPLNPPILLNGCKYTINTIFLTTSDIPTLPSSVYAVKIVVSWVQKGKTKDVSYITYYLKDKT